MSEFTAGILYLQNDAERVQEKLRTLDLSHKTISFSEQWAALFVRDEWMRHEKTLEQVLELSLVAPLLSFYNAEDHGWGYDILHEGTSKAEVNVEYMMEINRAWQLSQERYPEHDPYDPDRSAIWKALLEEVRASQEVMIASAKQFVHKNVAAFEVFGVDAEQIAELDQLLQCEDGSLEVGFEVVAEFKRILGIEDFSWVSYEYVESWAEMMKSQKK